MRSAVLLATTTMMIGCNPVVTAELLAAMSANQKETEHFSLSNETDNFYISADHHNFQAIEEYSWKNTGEMASVEGAAKPSCPNDITVAIWDAEGKPVFLHTFEAPHCWKDKPEHWDPIITDSGSPGTWTIRLTYDITGVKDMWFRIQRVGDRMVWGSVEERVDGQGHDGEHHDNGCQVVRWNAESAKSRTVTETYLYKNCGTTALVDVSWARISEGSLEIEIRDAWGEVVYDSILSPRSRGPIADETDPGHPGEWTVTFFAVKLSCDRMAVYIEG